MNAAPADPALSDAIAVTDRLAEAWNANDGRAYARWFTEDSDYVAYDGTRLRGRQANEVHHDRLFATVLRGSRLVFEATDGVLLTPDVVVVHGEGSVLLSFQHTAPKSRQSIQTYVLHRGPDGWRIAAFHNTRIRPQPLPDGLLLKLILLGFRLRTWWAGR